MRSLAACLLFVFSASAFAQAYPSKPIRFVTQFAPGSSGDISLRTVVPSLSEGFGQPAVVDNRAGAGGELSAQLVARAAPDGYTILHSTSVTQIIRPWLVKGTSFDPIKDFTPITFVYVPVYLIVANPSAPFNTMKELIDYAKSAPGKLSYGTSGIGTDHHLNALQIQQITGIDIVHVPYKATGQAQVDVMSGQLPMTFTTSGNAIPMLKTRKLKAIAVVRTKPIPLMPGLGAVGDAVPGFQDVPSWVALFGPAGLPRPVIERIREVFNRAMHQPDAMARWTENGYELMESSQEDMAALIKQQFELVGRIVKTAGIKPE